MDKINTRKIFVYGILSICIIAVNIAVYLLITQKPKLEDKKSEVQIDTVVLTENFNQIFNNKLDIQNNVVNVQKTDSNKDLVYTSYTNQDRKDGLYEMNVYVPCVNINTATAQKINQEINNLFYNKAVGIMTNTSQNSIYNVEYKAYINDNILSLVIRATIKEGQNPQRVIMKTYNYNLSSHSELKLKEIIQYRNLSEDFVQNRIITIIQKASENANKYSELGYTKYLRNSNDNMYKIENTTGFFLGEEKALYILYAYGNSNYTSEMDLLVI